MGRKNKEAKEELEKAKVLEQQRVEIEESSNFAASQQVISTVGHQIRENKPDVQHVPGVGASVLPSSVINTMKRDVLLPVHADESGVSLGTLSSSPSKPKTETIISK